MLVYRPPTVGLTVTPAQARARRAAGYKVAVHNPFQVPQTIRLDAAERTGSLNLRWPDRSADVAVQLPPGRTEVVRLRVSPIVRHRGTAPRTLAFSVAATPVRPPGHARSEQALFVALPTRRWPGRRAMLIGAGVVLGLLALLDVQGNGGGPIGWPELLVAVTPLVGGIVLRTVWWVLLYSAGLGAALLAVKPDQVKDALGRSADDRLRHDRLLDTLRAMYLHTPNGMRDRLSEPSSPWMIEKPSTSVLEQEKVVGWCKSDCAAELAKWKDDLENVRRSLRTSEEPLVWCVTEWNILALAALCAVVGTVVGKVLAKGIARR